MGAVVTAASGYDLGYVWRGAGAPEKSSGGYYINAAQAGEAPGRWFGPGAEALGLPDGGEVERGAYDAVYSQADPRTGERLGRAAGKYTSYEEHLGRLLAMDPHATAGRRLELEAEARRQTRQPAPYTDVTASFSKSISVLHASIRENARRARMAGDDVAESYWEGREQEFQAVLQAANRAMLAHAQEWAGVTRVGYHGAKASGQDPGRFAQAKIAVSSWLQGTSRDGDPQDHIHNQVARMVETNDDGKWRALDTVSLRDQLPALQAIVAAHAEAGLSRAFGVAWVPRADGRGNEIRGITQAQMDAYSKRTEAIKAATPAAVADWTARHGRAPNSRELLFIQNVVTLDTRTGKEDAQIDWDEYARKWDATLGGALAQIAPAVSNAGGRGAAAAGREYAPAQAEQMAFAATRRALATVQAASSTWTRAELVQHIGRALPAEIRPGDPDAAVAQLHRLADRAIAGEFEAVDLLEGPQWPPLPERLVRDLDGRSVYTRPGTERYCTRVQLALEERLVQNAQRQGAPRLAREACAAQLGADADALDAQLLARAQEARESAGCGLRMDQAAALHHVLTSPRTTEVLVGPAGSGKTRTLAEAAKAWISSGMGEVVGLATSQSARNVLAGAGVDVAENTSVFLGHTPEKRGARGIRRKLARGSLVVIDEASMMSVADMVDITEYAAARGCKVITAGDPAQLTAVEGGGGLSLLAHELGHVQLAVAVRFRQEWEQEASLRLRNGDESALADYDAHGRIRGGDPEEVLESARRMYVSHCTAGTDVELVAQAQDTCRELARRVRDDLQHLGLVERGREVELADGARASVGDLIVCRKNDGALQVGDGDRTIANGDVMRVEGIRENGSLRVRLALDRDAETGERRWADRPFTYTRDRGSFGTGYATANLGYAGTGHRAQGRTVTVGLPVVTGSECRQWLYSAATRGAEKNIISVMTRPATIADPGPRTRTAPELDRHARLQRERDGLPPLPAAHIPPPAPREPAAVLADVLARDDSEVSATETRRRALADVDHLARLNAMWQGEVGALQTEHYRAVVRAELPAGYEGEALDSRQATWLWRTMRTAEAAGMDPQEVARRALNGRPLTGARDVASVLDARIRKDLGAMVPAAVRPWAEQVPQAGDPETQRFVTELAAAMDGRKERIGEHCAEHPPAWSADTLGPVPDEPLARLEWERRAAHIGAYREMYGWTHETEPIGPEPGGDAPEMRAAWHAAWASMTRTGEIDLRGQSDGSLHHMRGTYSAETEWAPAHVGAELRQVRAAEIDAEAAALRADAETAAARAAGDEERAGRHEMLAASSRAARAFYQQRAEADAALMEDRDEWERVTDGSRRLAVAADAELRRRNPGEFMEPLRSAEPPAAPDERPEVTGDEQAAELRERLAAQRAAFREQLERRQGVMVPAEDPDYEPEGEAWPAWTGADRDAVLQPPKPDLQPAQRVLEMDAERQAGR